MVGLVAGSLLSIKFELDPLFVIWLVMFPGVLIGALYRDFFRWLWTDALLPFTAAAVQAVLRLRSTSRHP